ncbi:MAG: Fic/DOC family protein, partial [Candidatus Yanofskybacteria bacterium GW2011_GWB1_45_11]
MKFEGKKEAYISLKEATKFCNYSQEYLSLMARRGMIRAKKIGRNWFVTKDSLDEYLKKQSVLVSLPKNFVFKNGIATLTAADNSAGNSDDIISQFERLNSAPKIDDEPVVSKPVVTPAPQPHPDVHKDDRVISKLDRLSDSLQSYAQSITSILPRIVEKISVREEKSDVVGQALSPEEKEYISVQSQSFGYKIKKLNYVSRHSRTTTRLTAVSVAAIVILFLLVGGFSFGNIDKMAREFYETFKDATSIQGHFAGTHADEVLLLDKSGNISIFGHIETRGQLRSFAENGIAPIVVDSMTKVENLNSDYFDDLDSKDFTLAFVTKNGNITYEDVFLEGNVEVGKTLTVNGAVKLLDSLTVHGKLGVFSDAVFGKDITLTAGSLNIDKGTIKINDTQLVKNLNAEYLDGIKKGDINLDFVTSNGAETGRSITVGGIKVRGQSEFYAPGFFYDGVWGESGAFGTLGVAGDTSIGDNSNRDKVDLQIYSKNFTLDTDGNGSFSGNVGIGATTTTSDLVVSSRVESNLIP